MAGAGRPAGRRGAGDRRVGLGTVAREWGRIGCIGFGGPPAHIALLRRRVVEERGWVSAAEFEDGIAAVNLLPGPASTQLAIFSAWRVAGAAGAVVGGACFIVPGLVVILALAALFLSGHPPLAVAGMAAGADAAVPAVALAAAAGLVPASWRRASAAGARAARARWAAYLAAGGAAGAVAGPWVVLVLAACGALESAATTAGRRRGRPRRLPAVVALGAPHLAVAAGGLGAVVWVATKVGVLSYGGGFVIVPLMQRDAVHTYHWMSAAQFLTAVALGQITPGPVVQTVAVVGYAGHGVGGGLLASLVAFTPSFALVLAGGRHFERLRRSAAVQAVLTGAGAAAIGAIAGSAVPLGLALTHLWQVPVLALAAGWLVGLRRGVVPGLAGAAALGVVAALAGAPAG